MEKEARFLCENCGERTLTKEQYLSVGIMQTALCDTCKQCTKAQRKKRRENAYLNN